MEGIGWRDIQLTPMGFHTSFSCFHYELLALGAVVKRGITCVDACLILEEVGHNFHPQACLSRAILHQYV